MNQAIELYGLLILTFLGIIVPIVGLLLPIFQDGMSKLTTQYENERLQSEKNIKDQLAKIAAAKETDVINIRRTLDELESIKRTAERKLSSLKPENQIKGLFIPLLVSFVGVITFLLIESNLYVQVPAVLLSVGLFAYATLRLRNLLHLIVEVRRTIDDDRRARDNKSVELLSAILQRLGAQNFLKNVYISVNGQDLQDDERQVVLSPNTKQEVKIGIRNSEARLAENIEIGFTFPPDIIVEKKDYYSIFTDETGQIVRYTINFLHGNTHLILGPLTITALKIGSYKSKTFIKAKNIESTYRDLTLAVGEK